MTIKDNTNEREISVLELFNEKANKLENSRFTRRMLKNKVGFKLLINPGRPWKAKRFGPDNHSIDEFILTLRFFIQNNEKTSFENMAEIYHKLPSTNDLVQKFDEVHHSINKFLDNPSPINLGVQNISRRDIFEVFIWGGLAHANKKKKAEYDKWLANPIFPILEEQFVYILTQYLLAIFDVRELNEQVITLFKPVH
jgi:hypothetical protein